MNTKGYGSPYIPLSWLREQRKLARIYFQNGDTLTDYDLWLWVTRFEIDRLLILELQTENRKLRMEKCYDTE